MKKIYIKLNANNEVIQKQPYTGNGFIEVEVENEDDIVCGMIKNGDVFDIPAPDALQAVLNDREIEYIAAGMTDPYTVQEMMLDQLADAGIILPMKIVRDAIKTNNKKPA